METYYELLSPERTASETLEEEPVLFWFEGLPVTSEPTTIELTWTAVEAEEASDGEGAGEEERVSGLTLKLTLGEEALAVLKEHWEKLDAPTAAPRTEEPGAWSVTFEARPALLESQAVFLERMENPAEVLLHEDAEGASPLLDLAGYRLTDIRR